jgi:hypothetical protein
MPKFAEDPNFTLAWPATIVRAEIDRITAATTRDGNVEAWRDQIDLLLRQAFRSPEVAVEFARVFEARPDVGDTALPYPYGDEEPF